MSKVIISSGLISVCPRVYESTKPWVRKCYFEDFTWEAKAAEMDRMCVSWF